MNTDIKSKFKDIGFLSAESTENDLAKQVTSAESYNVCTRLNALAQSVLNRAVIHPDDRKEVYLTLYFQRMLTHYQAVIIMAERGMLHQVEIMLRCMLDTLFDLVAFHKHEQLFEALILGDNSQRLALLKEIREQQKTAATFTQEELDDLDKTIVSAEDIDHDDFKVYMKADMAGMLNDYRTTYSLLNATVHTTVRSIETDINFSQDSYDIVGFNAYGQSSDNMATLLMMSANYLIVGLEMLLNIFPCEKSQSELSLLQNQVQAEWQNIVVAVPHK